MHTFTAMLYVILNYQMRSRRKFDNFATFENLIKSLTKNSLNYCAVSFYLNAFYKRNQYKVKLCSK